MDATGQRQGEIAAGGPDDQSNGLAGVAGDIGGLGVVLGLLVELFDSRHLPSGLGGLDAIGQEDDSAIGRVGYSVDSSNHHYLCFGLELMCWII